MRNKKYAGIYVFNRAAGKSLDGRRNNHKSKSQEEIIEIQGAIPAIIPTEIFWKVQAKMDKKQRQNSKGRYKAQTVYILSGVIWCGECGKRMVGTSSSYHTRISQEHRKQYYYECNYSKRTGECGNGKIRKELAEEYVLSELEARLLNDHAIPELARKISIHYRQEKMNSMGEGLHLEQEINKIDKQINNLVQAITEGGTTVRAIVEQLKNLETKKSSLENRLQEWRIKQSQDLLSESAIASYLQHYRELLKSKDPTSCKQLVEEFVERVTINTDTIKVTFKVSVAIF